MACKKQAKLFIRSLVSYTILVSHVNFCASQEEGDPWYDAFAQQEEIYPLYDTFTQESNEDTQGLIDKATDVNQEVNNEGDTALHLAAKENELDIVQRLLQAGANPNLLNMYEKSPLHNAIETGNVEIVKTLLNTGADANTKDLFDNPPLHTAIELSDPKKAQLITAILLKAGAEPNTTNPSNEPALFKAIKRGQRQIVKMLLRAGANPNQMSMGERPLYEAAKKGNTDIVQLLLQAGAQIDREGWFSRLPPRAQELINKHKNILQERKTALEEACEYQAQRLPACATRGQGLIRDLRWLIEEFEGTRPVKPQRVISEEQLEPQGPSKRQRTHY